MSNIDRLKKRKMKTYRVLMEAYIESPLTEKELQEDMGTIIFAFAPHDEDLQKEVIEVYHKEDGNGIFEVLDYTDNYEIELIEEEEA